MKKYTAHETAIIEDGTAIGEGTKIWHHAQIRTGATIGKNCIFGKSAFVDTNVTIGNNVKVQNRASLYQGTTIEDDVFIGPHVIITNDLRPRARNQQWKITETKIKKGASIGANATIVCGSTIGEYAMVGAGAVVTKEVPAHALVYGNPARIQGYVCECGEKLDAKHHCPACNKTIKVN